MVSFNQYLGNGKRSKPAAGNQVLHGYKKATLALDPLSGQVAFKPYQTNGGAYAAVAEATCLYATHWRGFSGTRPTINKNCSCGFHAYKTPDDALRHVQYGLGTHDVLLKTVISGYFIEHELGYRSERQRVTDVYVGKCIYCHNWAQAIEIDNGRLWGACLNHALSRSTLYTYLTFDEFAARFAMPAESRYAPPVVHSIKPDVVPATRYQLEHEGYTEAEAIAAKNAQFGTKLSKLWHALFDITVTTMISVDGEVVLQKTKVVKQ